MQALQRAIAYMAEERKRKRKTYLLDSLVMEGIKELARRDGRSENQFVERLMFKACQDAGVIDKSEELLGETRGGGRS
jgi:hypothetical protein